MNIHITGTFVGESHYGPDGSALASDLNIPLPTPYDLQASFASASNVDGFWELLSYSLDVDRLHISGTNSDPKWSSLSQLHFDGSEFNFSVLTDFSGARTGEYLQFGFDDYLQMGFVVPPSDSSLYVEGRYPFTYLILMDDPNSNAYVDTYYYDHGHHYMPPASFTIDGEFVRGAAPEPVAWALLMLGMGLVGGALRCRRVTSGA